MVRVSAQYSATKFACGSCLVPLAFESRDFPDYRGVYVHRDTLLLECASGDTTALSAELVPNPDPEPDVVSCRSRQLRTRKEWGTIDTARNASGDIVGWPTEAAARGYASRRAAMGRDPERVVFRVVSEWRDD